MAAGDSSKSIGWDRAYAGSPPWETGRPQPVLVELAEAGAFAGRVLDVGCGSGEHALLAAQHGAEAVGLDVSPLAIEMAQRKASERGSSSTRFVTGSALELGALGETFDVVIDSGLVHVFKADDLRRYADSLGQVVREGGVVYMTTFSEEQSSDWGPRVAEADIRAAFGAGWTIEEFRSCMRETNRPEINVLVAPAFLARIRRTAPPLERTEPPEPLPPRRTRERGAELAAKLRHAQGGLQRANRSPLWVRLLAGAAEDAMQGGVVREAFADDPRTSASPPGLKLIAALRFLALGGEAPELAGYLIDGTPEEISANAWPIAKAALDANLAAVRDFLARPVQVNEPGLSAVLYGALLLLTERYGLPVRLLEVGASAGLNLSPDRFGYLVAGETLGDPTSPLVFREPWTGGRVQPLAAAAGDLAISHRAGCDIYPIDPTTVEGRHRLAAYLWSDQPGRIARLDRAIEAIGHAGPAIERASAPAWLAEQLAEPPAGDLTVIWRSAIKADMGASDHSRLASVIAAARAHATEQRPIASLELERPADAPGGSLALVLETWPDSSRQTIARSRPHGPPVTWEIFPSPPSGV